MWNTFVSVIKSWCSIKNDYRTLVGLEGVNFVEIYNDIEAGDNEPEGTLS
jgi:hypothetical protein